MKSEIFKEKFLLVIFLLILSVTIMFNRLSLSTLHFDGCCFAQQAKEIIATGEWLVPHFGGEVFLDNKPPLYMWILALFGRIFGFNNFSMKLPSAILGTFSVIFVFIIISKFFNNTIFGFLTSFILLWTQQFIYYSRAVTMEILFALFLFLSFVSFWLGYNYKINAGFILMGVFAGLAVMTRNIPGFLPYFIVFIYLLYLHDYSVFKNIYFLIGIIVSLIICLPWHVYMYVKFGDKFVSSYFFVIAKYFFQERRLWYEYIRKLLETYWPWVPFLVMGLYDEIKLIVKSYKKDFSSLMFFYILVWFLLIQISKYKFPQHMVPLYFPLAIFSAKGLLKIDEKKNYLFTRIFIFIGVLYTAISVIFPVLPKTLDLDEYRYTMKVFDSIKSLNQPVYVLKEVEFWHYYDGALFYANKKLLPVSYKDFEKSTGYFLIKKDKFSLKNIKYDTILETERDILIFKHR